MQNITTMEGRISLLDEKFQLRVRARGVFLNTASEDTLGTGVTSLGPQVFYVKFLPTGLLAPGL